MLLTLLLLLLLLVSDVVLQAAVVARGWAFCRIDGSMSSTDARQAEVERFQAAGSSFLIFLLTTQVCSYVCIPAGFRHCKTA
jgi:hypothetical protein